MGSDLRSGSLDHYERLSLIDPSCHHAHASRFEEEGSDHRRARPRGLEGYRNRQLYLHSYQFTREQTVSERMKSSLRRLKDTAWTVMACNSKQIFARKIKDKLRRTSQYLSSRRSLVTAYVFKWPQCLRLPA